MLLGIGSLLNPLKKKRIKLFYINSVINVSFCVHPQATFIQHTIVLYGTNKLIQPVLLLLGEITYTLYYICII